MISFLVSFYVLSAVTLSKVIADSPISSCNEQNPCIKFTSTPANSKSFSGGFEICAVVDFSSPECSKSDIEHVDYTCLHNLNRTDSHSLLTTIEGYGFSPLMKLVPKVKNGYTQCQVVPEGEDAQFLFFDGVSCIHANDETYTAKYDDFLSVKCSARKKDKLGCSKNKQNVECAWTVTSVGYNEQSVTGMSISQDKDERQLQASTPTRAPVAPTRAPTKSPKPDKCPFEFYFIDAGIDRVLTPEIVDGKKYSRLFLAQQLSLLVKIKGATKLKFNFGNIGQRVDKISPFTLGGEIVRTGLGSGALVRIDILPAPYLSYSGKKTIKVSAYTTLTGRDAFCTETISFTLTR